GDRTSSAVVPADVRAVEVLLIGLRSHIVVADGRRLGERPGRIGSEVLLVLALAVRDVDLIAHGIEEARILCCGQCRVQGSLPAGGVVRTPSAGADLRIAEDEEFAVAAAGAGDEVLNRRIAVLFAADSIGVL